jgi:hypothetical protein
METYKQHIARLLFEDQPYSNGGMYKEQLLEIECLPDMDRDVMSIVECGGVTYTSVLN